jgi:hypothetical protein
MLLATVWNIPLTEPPIETSNENAAIEMKNATIAYSIAVAPLSPSRFLKRLSINFSASAHPVTVDNVRALVDDL